MQSPQQLSSDKAAAAVPGGARRTLGQRAAARASPRAPRSRCVALAGAVEDKVRLGAPVSRAKAGVWLRAGELRETLRVSHDT